MDDLMKNYNEAKQAIYDDVGFVEDWVVCPIDDCTDQYWMLIDNPAIAVRYFEDKENLFSEKGNYYQDDIYTQRFYQKHVYRGNKYTMVFCDPHTDGMKWFRVFDNGKEVKG